MSEKKDIIRLADEAISNGEEWLRRASEVYDSVPYVEQSIKLSREIKSAFADSPLEFDGHELTPIRDGMEQTNRFLIYDTGTFSRPLSSSVTGSAFLLSSSSGLSGLLVREARNPQPEVAQWAEYHLIRLNDIQADEWTKGFITKHLDLLHTGSEQEFADSILAFLAVKNDIGLASAAGIAMRNVIESLNGNLKDLARRNLGSTAGQKLTWPATASAIAKGGAGSSEDVRLTAQESDYGYLHGEAFTKIAKNDWIPTGLEWEALYARYISFLYTTLALIDFARSTSTP